ncbi:hypothetical protein QVD17_08806 [Tagetes erecta]|uniref:Uncharacterized protein n=1 Tax=Tagetes erecta TaxID=13708 RepID=A0AAD8P3D9_TARER|nr:hypothetical protein QVD17_08806 [Tagetes erecta]
MAPVHHHNLQCIITASDDQITVKCLHRFTSSPATPLISSNSGDGEDETNKSLKIRRRSLSSLSSSDESRSKPENDSIRGRGIRFNQRKINVSRSENDSIRGRGIQMCSDLNVIYLEKEENQYV